VSGRVVGLALAILASGCAMSVEGELPEIEVTQHDLRIPGVPRELRTGEVSVTLPSFFQPNDHLGLPIDSYKSVKVKDVVLLLKKDGGGDLSFVRTLGITINGLQGYLAGVAPAEVGRYQRSSSGTVGATISARKDAPVEVVDAWRDSQTVMTIEASGDLPEDAWTVDVVVRLSALLQY
jgi:hypothetical protein